MKLIAIVLSCAVMAGVQFRTTAQGVGLVHAPLPPILPPIVFPPQPQPLPPIGFPPQPLPPILPLPHPLPPILLPPQPLLPFPTPNQIINSLTLPGYDFNVVEISGQNAELLVDPTEPIILPLNSGNPQGIFPGQVAPGYYGVITNTLGFTATFTLANKTAVDRTFSFAAPYYANLRVGFRVLDENDNVIWQSYQLLADIPPDAPTSELTLAKGTAWTNQVFVPILEEGQSVIGSGTYTVEAEILGSPAFSARSSFEVGYSVGGPIIHPIPLPLPLPINPPPIIINPLPVHPLPILEN